jgi:DNA repair exonuclease SbcCD ATPase subunit
MEHAQIREAKMKSLNTELQQKQLRIERLEAELSNAQQLEQSRPKPKTLAQADLRIVEADKLRTRIRALKAELAGIRKAFFNFLGLEKNFRLLDLVKQRVRSLVGDIEIQKQQNEVQEIELKQLRKQNLQKRQEFRDQKQAADKALKVANSLRREIESLKAVVVDKSQRLLDVEGELRDVASENATIQKKHQSALRLIGELWTKNQSLVQGQLHRKRMNTSK